MERKGIGDAAGITPAPSLRLVIALAFGLFGTCALAQTVLPKVDVIAPKWETHRGGYTISSNFTVDSRMSAVIYPAEPFSKGDIFDFRTVRMADDEYFVLQECVSSDCTQGHVLQVWTSNGPLGQTGHAANQFWIPHDGKMFMWMQRFPMSGGGGESGSTFGGYEPMSPPLVLNPVGTPEQFHACDVAAAQAKGPVKVISNEHDGSQLKLRFETGSTVFIQRMRATQ